jgi:hypothetical protein
VASRLSHQSKTPSYVRTEGGRQEEFVQRGGVRFYRDQVGSPSEQITEQARAEKSWKLLICRLKKPPEHDARSARLPRPRSMHAWQL